ncbi:MAG TPA: PEGA domain-containing protein [Polyangia bacterium]|jgi:Tfp pilus assembly protein PilZ
MSPDDPALQPVIVLRVVIRSPDLDTFVSKYSRFVKDDRIFIFTKSSQPAGTRVRFTLELADGQPLLFGEGTVTRIRSDTGDPSKPPGMELKFQPLDEPSRELLGRMLRARDLSTGQFSAVTTPPSPSSPSQFREETTDAQTNIRDGSTSSAIPREFEESPPTLPPLAKTGAQQIIKGPEARQDESGAVTLAQAPPSDHVDAPPPSLPLHVLPSPPIPDAANIDKQSGGFSTPTPLPAPIPAAPEEFGGSPPPTKLARPSHSDAVTTGVPAFDAEQAFVAAGPAPAFAEAFRSPIPGVPVAGAPSAGGKTVPANPFSEVSDGAIEYFVEWSLEQSTAPKPKVAEAHFANVVMATPRAERRRSMRAPLLGGIAIGIFLGLPLGGAIVWFGRPLPPPVIVEKMPEVGTPRPVAADDLALARAETPDLAAAKASAIAVKPVKPSPVAVKPSAVAVKPSAVAVKPAQPSGVANAASGESDTGEKPDKLEKPVKPGKEDAGELAIVTHPSGAAVSVDGEAKGKTPLTLSLPVGAHEISVTRDRYATVTQPVEVPAKLELTLKRPTATLHVDSEPAGGEVIVEGKPRGKTPVDVTLDAFHHYDVQVTLLGTKPWHKRVSLKPPQTDVTAKLSVVHNP